MGNNLNLFKIHWLENGACSIISERRKSIHRSISTDMEEAL